MVFGPDKDYYVMRFSHQISVDNILKTNNNYIKSTYFCIVSAFPMRFSHQISVDNVLKTNNNYIKSIYFCIVSAFPNVDHGVAGSNPVRDADRT